MSLVGGGCINLAFAVGSLVPALFLDRIGRRRPMGELRKRGSLPEFGKVVVEYPLTSDIVIGTIGMGFSHMCISILLSFNGTDKEQATANASIAFFTIVSSSSC